MWTKFKKILAIVLVVTVAIPSLGGLDLNVYAADSATLSVTKSVSAPSGHAALSDDYLFEMELWNEGSDPTTPPAGSANYTVQYYVTSFGDDGAYVDTQLHETKGSGTIGDFIPFDLESFKPVEDYYEVDLQYYDEEGQWDSASMPPTGTGYGKITADESLNLIKICYTPAKTSYEVNFIDLAGTVLAQRKISEGRVTMEISGQEQAINIPGYIYSYAEPEVMSLQVDPGLNVLKLIYTEEKIVNYSIKYYKDKVDDRTILGIIMSTGALGSSIFIDRDMYRPAGDYKAEIEGGGSERILTKDNEVFTVIYRQDTESSLVEEASTPASLPDSDVDSQSAGNLEGSKTVQDREDTQAIKNDATVEAIENDETMERNGVAGDTAENKVTEVIKDEAVVEHSNDTQDNDGAQETSSTPLGVISAKLGSLWASAAATDNQRDAGLTQFGTTMPLSVVTQPQYISDAELTGLQTYSLTQQGDRNSHAVYTFTLKNGETMAVKGLPEGTRFTVKELGTAVGALPSGDCTATLTGADSINEGYPQVGGVLQTGTAEAKFIYTLSDATQDKVTIKGIVEWNDTNNSGNTRPESVTVDLLLNGTLVTGASAVANSSNGWSFSFTVEKDVETYTVQQTPAKVEGYDSAVYSGDAATSFVITNNVTTSGGGNGGKGGGNKGGNGNNGGKIEPPAPAVPIEEPEIPLAGIEQEPVAEPQPFAEVEEFTPQGKLPQTGSTAEIPFGIIFLGAACCLTGGILVRSRKLRNEK